MSKNTYVVPNHAGGMDLVTERDGGNVVRILTGKPSCSRDFWEKIQELSEQVLFNLPEED